MSGNYKWSQLSHLQLGRYAEYFVKMEFTLAGFDVYSAEVDERGIDFVLRKSASDYYDIQVKSVRTLHYTYFPKKFFKPRENLLVALVVCVEGNAPDFYLIPSIDWVDRRNDLLVSHDYDEDKKSEPEWGINLSQKNMPILRAYAFDKMYTRL